MRLGFRRQDWIWLALVAVLIGIIVFLCSVIFFQSAELHHYQALDGYHEREAQ